ncbi:MAG: Uma2 family endonuclease, partial [Actinobacteria bacterium]|nr:Uma2 family endonuclease [Actinomycetota bacterium]
MGVSPPARRWTRDEYYRMAETGILRPDDRVELIDGEILTKSPQRSVDATAVLLSQEALHAAFGAGFDVRPQLPLALGEASEPEPDLAVVPGVPRDYRESHPTTALLVVEVAETSLAFDRGGKQALYARAGIPEYWIVDLVEGTLEVFRSPGIQDYGDR